MPVSNLRPELAQHLRQRLDAFREGFRQNLALLGPPGSGKTFQLQQLISRHPSNTIVLYCPLYRESCRSFLQRLLGAIAQAPHRTGAGQAPPAEQGTPQEHSARQLTQPLAVLLQDTERHAPRTVQAIRQIEPLITRRVYGEAFIRALDAIPILIEERRQPCLFILDEFLFLEALGLPHAFHELGKRVMTWHATLFVLASSSVYRARAILRERLQLLFGQFELLTLDALDPIPATAWVHQELKGLRGAKTISPFLLQWLGAYPWYLAVFLKRLKELATLSKNAELSEALFFSTAWDLLGCPSGTLHQWCVSRLDALVHARVGARAQEALIQVAEGARTATELGKRIGRGGLSDALQLLVEHDLAQRNGMCWMVPDPILRCWLSTVLLVQRADARPDAADGRQRFERHLRRLWTDWIASHQLSFPEQVVTLFGKFRDDTISLDSKTGRLPKFLSINMHRPEGCSGGVFLIADGPGKRWCATVPEGLVDESAVAGFDEFCRAQIPKPSRKVVIAKSGMDQNARLLAKAANMWVWGAEDVNLLKELYGHP